MRDFYKEITFNFGSDLFRLSKFLAVQTGLEADASLAGDDGEGFITCGEFAIDGIVAL